MIHRALTVFLIAAGVILLFPATPAVAQRGPLFYEISSFSGGVLKSGTQPSMGLSVGVTKGKNMFGVEGSAEWLGTYVLGLGHTYTNFGDSLVVPMSTSRILDLGGRFRRDLYSRSRVTVYGTVGGDYIHSRFHNLEPIDGTVVSRPILHYVDTIGLEMAAGLRLRLWKGIGIRAEMNGLLTNGTAQHTEQTGTSTRATPRDVVARSVFGIYFRWLGGL